MKLTVALIVCLFAVVQCLTPPQQLMSSILDEVAESTDWQIEESDTFNEAFLDLFADESEPNRLLFTHVAPEEEDMVKKIVSFAPNTRPVSEMKISDSTLIMGPRILFLLRGNETSATYFIDKLTNESTTKNCSVCSTEVTVQPVNFRVVDCLRCGATVCGDCIMEKVSIPDVAINGGCDDALLPRCIICNTVIVTS